MNITIKKKYKKKIENTKKRILKLNKKIDKIYNALSKELKFKRFSREEDHLFDYVINDSNYSKPRYE